MPIRFTLTIRFLFLAAVAIYGFGATGAYAVPSNPGDPLFCEPNEGVTFLTVNGGAGVFTANSDCFGGNPANNTQLTISTSNGGSLVTTDHSDYVYTPPSSTFTGADQFTIHVTTVFNAAGGPGSAGGTSFGSSGPATLTITLNVISGNVTLLDTPNTATLIPVPAGSITGCGNQASQGNAGQGPPASAVAGCVTSVARGEGNTAPSHGTLTTSGNTLLYTPTAGFVGIDTFTYQAFGPNTDGASALSSGNVKVTMDVFHTIDTAVPSYNASALGVTLAPIFNGGTLVLDQPGATYSQGFTLNNSTTNTIDQTGHSATFSGVFSDATTGGNITIANSGSGGSVTFSGTNTYTGTTTINSGASLIVNGSIATSSAVKLSGTLSGTGTVGATTVNSGGILQPGSGVPGTSLTVAGSLAFASGAMYLVMVNPTTASFAQVTGTASLGGSALAIFAPGSYLGKQYTILQAAGLGGTTFASLTTNNLPAGFLASLSYTPTSVLLNLTGSLPTAGLSTNQTNVAGALSKFFNGGGALPPSFVTLFGLTDGNLQAALTQASGETATGTQQTTFDAMNLFMGLLTDPFVDGRGDTGAVSPTAPPAFAEEDSTASSYTSNGQKRSGSERDAYGMMTKAPMMLQGMEQRWSVWAAGFGGSQTTDGNAALGSNSVTSRIAGTAVGADYRVSPTTLAGFAMSGGATSFSVANSGGGHSDLFQVGAFVRHNVGPAYVAATLAYGWQDVTTNRTVTITGIDQLQARFNANAYSGRVEGGYRFVMPGTGAPWGGMPAWTAMPWAGGLGITPYVAAQFTTFQLPAYAERAVSGTNNFALSFGSQSVTDPRSELGVRTDKSYALTDSILTLRTRFAWAHDYDPNRAVGATFQSLPGASFVVNGAAQSHDSALTTASAEMKWRNGWSTAATFEGEFSNVTSSYGGKAVVRYAW